MRQSLPADDARCNGKFSRSHATCVLTCHEKGIPSRRMHRISFYIALLLSVTLLSSCGMASRLGGSLVRVVQGAGRSVGL